MHNSYCKLWCRTYRNMRGGSAPLPPSKLEKMIFQLYSSCSGRKHKVHRKGLELIWWCFSEVPVKIYRSVMMLNKGREKGQREASGREDHRKKRETGGDGMRQVPWVIRSKQTVVDEGHGFIGTIPSCFFSTGCRVYF